MDDTERFQDTLTAAADGAEWALAELYRDLYPRLLRYLRTIEPSDAEDLATDVWLELAAALAHFEGGATALRALAFTIARRRVIDLRRRRGRRATEPMEPERLTAHGPLGNAEDEAMDALTTEAALALIATLSRDEAEVIVLRILGGLSVTEVASIMDRRPGTIRVLQHRGLRRLAGRVQRERVTG